MTGAPVVTGVVAAPGTGVLGYGQSAVFSVTFSAPVTVVGQPTLTLNDGGQAAYGAGSGTNTLTFVYTVGSGDTTPDLAVQGLLLNGGTIVGATGIAANLAGAAANPAGTLQVDGTAKVTSVTAPTGTIVPGAYGVQNSSATLVLAMSAPVTVSGTPVLLLNDGGTATYSAASSSSTALAFTYTVLPGQSTPDLAVTGISLNGATIRDGRGANADVTGAVANPAGTLVVDGTPKATSIQTVTSGSPVGIGSAVTFTVRFNQSVSVGGTPALTLSNGGTAAYVSGTGTSTLTFSSVVGAGQSTSDLKVTGVALNGGAINSASAVTLAPAAYYGAGLTASFSGFYDVNGDGKSDIVYQNLMGTFVQLANGQGGFGSPVAYTGPLVPQTTPPPTVDVNGDGRIDQVSLDQTNGFVDVQLAAADGTFGPVTPYADGTTGPAGFVVADLNGDGRPDLVVGASSGAVTVLLNNGNGGFGAPTMIVNPANAGLLTALSNTSTLTVADMNGDGKADLVMLDVSGNIQILLGDGHGGFGAITTLPGLGKDARFGIAAGTLLVTDLNGDGKPDIVESNYTASYDVLLNTTPLSALDASSLSTASGADTGVAVIAAAPAVTGVAATPSTAVLGYGQTATFSVTFSAPVTVSGLPSLILNDGGQAYYASGSGTGTLTFQYTVGSGDTTPDLAVRSLALNGGGIAGAGGVAADVSGAAVNPAGTLQVDATAKVTGVTAPTGTLLLNSGATFVLAMSAPVTVSGAPTLLLNDGGTATYNAASSTSTSLAFSYTAAAGQNTPDLAVTGVSLNGGTILDGRGGAADLTAAAVNPAGILKVNTTPTVSPDPLFDPTYYLATYPSVAASGVDPYTDYMTVGWTLGRNPSALFNTTYYLNQNPDVAAAGVNPLTHFETFGWKEGRDPSLAFSDSRYLAANPDVAAAGIDPLLHYTVYGRAEGRADYAATPHATRPQNPLVDAAYVYAHNPAVAAAGLDATAWYTSVGWQQGANPDAYFDTNYYLDQNPDVRAAGMDPLTHFETFGWKEGRQPSLVFDDGKYLAAYPDVKAAGFDPLQHYESNGQFEGRATFLTGSTGTADPLVNAAYYDQQLGATLIPTGTAAAQQAQASYDATGWQQGLNPDAFFNTAYYLSHNPDVAAAHIDPLLHYETFGWKEGRDPSASFSTNKYLAAYADVRAAGVDPLLHYVVNGQAEGRTAFAV